MHKLIPPMIGLAVSSFFLYRTVSNLPNPVADGSAQAGATTTESAKPQDQRPAKSPHLAMIRFLSDIDDLLDKVHDRASFAAIKPKLLARTQQHAKFAAAQADQGMTQFSPEASKQLQTAANRHMQSLARAIEAVGEVEGFFAHDLATILDRRK
jgi:hypothetical protein